MYLVYVLLKVMQLSKNYKTKQKKNLSRFLLDIHIEVEMRIRRRKKFNLKLNNIRKNIVSNNNLNQDKGGHIT